MSEERTFQIGDKVQWMNVSYSGSGCSMSTRTGTITQFSESVPMARIKLRNGRVNWVECKSLRFLDEKSPVNDVFEKFVEASKR